jgi:hypothetical protein
MKKQFLVAALGVLALGSAGCEDVIPEKPWNGRVMNYDRTDVTDLEPDPAMLEGEWLAVKYPFSHTDLNGEILPIAYMLVAMENILEWRLTFGPDGRGRGVEQFLGGGPYGISPTMEYDFGWSLAGHTLTIEHDTDVLNNPELEAQIREYHTKYGYEMGDPRAKIAQFMYGDRGEWIVTQLTDDKLALHYFEIKDDDHYGKTWWNQWYVFEREAGE